jgi:hypothetical protein
MMQKFEVVLELEIRAETPEQAATIARDMMLDPCQPLLCDVHPFERIEEADDWFPDRKRGWQARFDKHGGVRPADMIAWYQMGSDP